MSFGDKLLELLTSRKAIVAMLAIVAVVVLCALGRVTGADALAFVKWILAAWLGAQALVDAKRATLPSSPSETPSDTDHVP